MNISNNDNRFLPVMEDFYSLQGEGFHTGSPAYFIRIGGCDNGCNWCDVKESWDANQFPATAIDDVLSRALQHPARTLVITGGEPLNYDLSYLTEVFQNNGFEIHLETSGTAELTGEMDWICLSPKKQQPPLEYFYPLANELKVIIETADDFNWAEQTSSKVNANCHLFLQPEWSKSKTILPAIIEYAKANPKWSVSLQSHKWMNIP